MITKSEKIGANKTPATLFVGVGGIGSDIVTRVAERCLDAEKENIRFVAMDTNANDLRGVKSSKSNIIPIQTSSTQSVLDYLKNDDDARTMWFPNNTTLYPKTVSEGAGQVRAVSRLALNATIKTGEINKLYKAIDDLFLKDGGDLKQALRVVVASSAAGGTGSGIAMTVGMLIREYLHKHYREKSAIIRGFLLLPGVMDTVISTETERESLRRNGYATIKEINAFMIKASGFCGVKKELERYKDLHIDVPTTTKGVDRLENLPFDFCFLLDRVDQHQESMQTLEQYKEFAAQSLYEQNIGPMQRDAFSMEDNIIKEFANDENNGRNRFGGLGAAILRYPYEDVADYIAYSRAIERIGDGETVGEWVKYDQRFKLAMAEYKKKRLTSNEAQPLISNVYVDEFNNDDTRFGNDMKRYISGDTDKAKDGALKNIRSFLNHFETEMRDTFLKRSDVKGIHMTVSDLGMEKNYESDENARGHATDNLATIRNYEGLIKKYAASTAKSRAKSVLYDAPSIESTDLKPYHLERLLKSPEGAMHPNAMRYMIYLLRNNLDKKYREYKSKAQDLLNALAMYSPYANDEETFDVKAGYSKEKEKCIDDVCNIENVELSVLNKIAGGFTPFWKKLNELFPSYVAILNEYRDALINEAAYDIAINYVSELCKQFEDFYSAFEAKVIALTEKKDEIIEKLKFRKGDSVCYVCGTKEQLDMLAQRCPEGTDGLLLPEKLNADIYNTVKKNAECDRLAAYDSYGDYSKTDVFDKVLIDYFRESVRTECADVIDLDIMHAIITEQKFKEYIEANSLIEDGEPRVNPTISDDSRLAYLKDKIKLGTKLASPGIGNTNFNEPRIVAVSAFNKALADLKDVEVKKTIQTLEISPVATDTVSKYDLRFFNALYNVTPDKLAKFRSPEDANDNKELNSAEGAGVYYDAYHKYIKKIGPDSTKSATISLHIDKRWDSLTEMPEISMAAHKKAMMRIHSALIYGVVHGMIKTQTLSRYDEKKRIFVLEDEEGDTKSLVVSNNTECDQFYEVLDALYRDRASVENIYQVCEARRKFDENTNRRYSESSFFMDTNSFKIGDGHGGVNSLFEIPLMYYNSLPRALMDDNELAIMIDSVIDVLSSEVIRFEKENDRESFLAKRLVAQFKILVENFCNDEYNVDDRMRKNTEIEDNRVINMVYRKVGNAIKQLNPSDLVAILDEMKTLINK